MKKSRIGWQSEYKHVVHHLSLNELSEIVHISLANLSKLKTGKVKAIRFSTLEAVCTALNCQPGDILENSEEKK